MSKLLAGDGNIIVVMKSMEKKSDSGLIVSASARGVKHQEGEVVTVGERVSTIEVGDTVIIQQGVGFDLVLDSNEWKVIKADQVLAILRD